MSHPEKEIRPMPEGQISVIAGSNAHTELMQILAKIVLHIYPSKALNQQCREIRSRTVLVMLKFEKSKKTCKIG